MSEFAKNDAHSHVTAQTPRRMLAISNKPPVYDWWFLTYRNIRNLPYLMITLLIITLFALKFVEFANAYQHNENPLYENYNQQDFYLNLDNLNLNNQDILFDLNDVDSDVSKSNKTVNIVLEYNAAGRYDINNNGIENLNGVIDFSVSNTAFNWNVDKSKLCTRWEIYSIDQNKLNTICYGNNNCCKFINLASSRSNWSEILYLTYGMHDASENNVVSAQVM